MIYSSPLREIEMDFHLIADVLDELYAQLPLKKESEKAAAVKARLESLSSKYYYLEMRNDIDYRDPITCFAYLYCYVTAHANIVSQLIRDSSELSSIFDSEKVRVSCIGGGPGSDLLGILRFMRLESKSTILRCGIYDRQKAWRDSLGTVCNSFDLTLPLSPYFRVLDVTAPEACTEYQELFEADLFTMSFLLSELYSNRTKANAFFEMLFQKARTGALFLILDNSYSKFHNWFDYLIRTNGLKILHANQAKFCTRSDIGYLEYYRRILDHNPKTHASAAYRICCKL